MISRVLWQRADHAQCTVTNRVQTIIKHLINWISGEVVPYDAVKALRVLLAMAVQWLTRVDMAKQRNDLKGELVRTFTVAIGQLGENQHSARLCHALSLLKPDWLAQMVLGALATGNPSSSRGSLRSLLRSFAVYTPSEELTKEYKEKEHTNVSKKLKKNQYGKVITSFHLYKKS